MTTTATFANAGTSASAKLAVPAASVIPQGVGAPPPPGLDPKKGKLMCIKVRMLDDTVGVFHLGHKAVGQALFEEVCRHLNLLECDYFGLEFHDCYGTSCWLDKEKCILKQITAARSDARFYFMIKFYSPNPADLEEEYTRYLFALQIKRDLSSGHFVCNENTAALMASYIVQSECGDFSSDDYYDHSYLSSVRFIPNQSAEFEKKVMENHKKLIGMSPAEADLALLETARRAEFYGVKFHTCRDIEGTQVNITVLHLGIKIYHQLSCASTFSWAKIRKLSFKRKKLFVKMHPDGYSKEMAEFSFETRNECKMFWKKCIEHHTFFRCNEVAPLPRHQSKFFSKGSSFRYSGRTQKQLIDYVREHQKRREPFTRPLHSSMARKILSDERLLPTPISSQPGTLVRQNGNLASAESMETTPHAMGADQAGMIINFVPDLETDDGRAMADAFSPTSDVGQSRRKTKDESRSMVHANGSPSRDIGMSELSPTSNQSQTTPVEANMKLINSSNPYAISSPFRKGIRLQSIESSSSGQLTLAGSLQQLQASAGNSAKSASSDRRTPPKKQYEGAKSLDSHEPSFSNAHHNYENIEAYTSYESRAYHENGTSTANAASVERTVPVRLLLNDSAEKSLSSSHNVSMDNRVAKRLASSSKAFCITKELLMAERTYVRDLSIIGKHLKTVTTPFNDSLSSQQQQSLTPQTRHKTPSYVGQQQQQRQPDRPDVSVLQDIFSVFEPLDNCHENLLQEIERRHNAWENKLTSQMQLNQASSPVASTQSPSDVGVQKIGDILLCGIHNSLQTYQQYLSNAMGYLTSLNDLYRSNKKLATIYKEFEAQKLCYVPINLLLLKPLRRLLAYEAILTRLIAHYIEEGGINPDLSDCKVAQDKLSTLTNGIHGKSILRQLENFVKLVQIERDLNDVQNLVLPTRTFIREGSLQRFTRKEPVQRLFLLFNDCLLYAGRSGGSSSAQQMTFKLHGQIPLRGLMLENGDALRMSTPGLEKFAFTIYGGNRSFVVAASNAEEKQMWLEDINRAVMEAKESKADFPHFPSLKAATSADDVATTISSPASSVVAGGGTSTFKPQSTSTTAAIDIDEPSTNALAAQSPTFSGERHWYYRVNDTLHVCWHRGTTLNAEQLHRSAAKCQLSGYLLRKFRTSTGWQKLWVVLCDFCLFFHKNHQDGLPLASLPLLGYVITLPDTKDEIHKDFVFKLQYKTQYYFFRADSDFAYNRWLEVLRIVCHDQCDLR